MDNDSSRVVHEMAEAIASGQAVFFVGAGMSAMAGAPSWDELVAPLRRKLRPPSDETNPLLIAQFFDTQYGSNKLHSELQKQLNSRRLLPTRAHKQLCNMPASVFVTTNYDHLLETQLQELNVPYNVVMTENDLALWDEKNRVQILKLHGDLRSVTSIVLTHWDYVRFMNDRPLTKKKLSELFCYRTVIFLGYSLRDPNVSFIFNEITYQLGNLKRLAYIVTHDADPHQLGEWQRRGLRPVSLATNQDDLGPNVKQELMTQRMTDFLSRLLQEVRATNRSIMVVDDEDSLANCMKDILIDEIKDAKVHRAQNGLAAMYAIGRLRPRLLVVDLTMPRVSGWDLIEMIRQFPELDGIRIIVVSGDPTAAKDKRLAELRVDHFIAKPVNFDELTAVASHLLGIEPPFRMRSDVVPRDPIDDSTQLDSLFPPRKTEG